MMGRMRRVVLAGAGKVDRVQTRIRQRMGPQLNTLVSDGESKCTTQSLLSL
jgi:hypothetical protein